MAVHDSQHFNQFRLGAVENKIGKVRQLHHAYVEVPIVNRTVMWCPGDPVDYGA